MTAGRICCVCDRPIRGEAKVIPVDSASGARPNNYAHQQGDLACRPILAHER
ncbi:hypothetical protein ACIRP0_07695 [Streptomyces sp. NPDC101733]|uniref:hypothetical protein n=1 Tax=unclassified Streptomyces TaxID=2593676 RepID=UPI00381BBFF4